MMPLAVSRLVPGVLRCDPRAPRSAPTRPTQPRAAGAGARRRADQGFGAHQRRLGRVLRRREGDHGYDQGAADRSVETRSSSSPIVCRVECFDPWGWTSIAEGPNGAGFVGNSKRPECRAETREGKPGVVTEEPAAGPVFRRRRNPSCQAPSGRPTLWIGRRHRAITPARGPHRNRATSLRLVGTMSPGPIRLAP